MSVDRSRRQSGGPCIKRCPAYHSSWRATDIVTRLQRCALMSVCVFVGMHPPGPPLARPVLPRERGAMDRVIEYLVGDGPQNRWTLYLKMMIYLCSLGMIWIHNVEKSPYRAEMFSFSSDGRQRVKICLNFPVKSVNCKCCLYIAVSV